MIPLALGLAAAGGPDGAAGGPSAAALLLVPALTFLFLSRYAALPAAVRLLEGKPVPPGFLGRRLFWTAAYLGVSLACLFAALSSTPSGAYAATLWIAGATALLGAAQTVLAFAGRGRTLGGELLGMAGLASAAPLVIVASGGPVDARTLGAGLAALGYFVSSLAFVRAWRARARGRTGAGACIAAHLVLAVALAVLWKRGIIPAGALAAFVPVFARTAWGLGYPPPTIRTLGWREVVVAAAFTGMAAATLLGRAGGE
ncbi:MAG: YwiC-like family protein [Acidobacteria bacterium]|nr:YwiC-like family protein [Acidobacteriota bacterium]